MSTNKRTRPAATMPAAPISFGVRADRDTRIPRLAPEPGPLLTATGDGDAEVPTAVGAAGTP